MPLKIVLFKFKSDVSDEHKNKFVAELQTLRELPCVKDRMLWVGSKSVTNPISKSQGFEIALTSIHNDLAALEEYQASKEHERYVARSSWINVSFPHLSLWAP